MHKKAVGCFPFSFFHNFISRYSSYITWQMTFEVMGCICFLLLFFYLYVLLPFLSLFGHFTYTNQIRQYVCVCVCLSVSGGASKFGISAVVVIAAKDFICCLWMFIYFSRIILRRFLWSFFFRSNQIWFRFTILFTTFLRFTQNGVNCIVFLIPCK